jgi:hypothetical protein
MKLISFEPEPKIVIEFTRAELGNFLFLLYAKAQEAWDQGYSEPVIEQLLEIADEAQIDYRG